MHKTDTLSDSYFVNVLRNLRNVLYTSVKMQTVKRANCKKAPIRSRHLFDDIHNGQEYNLGLVCKLLRRKHFLNY